MRVTDENADDALVTDASYRDVADATPQLMWIADANGRLAWANRRWLAYTGQSLMHALLEGWPTRIHPDDDAQVQAEWRDAVRNGEPFAYEFRMRSSDNRYRWFLGRATPMDTAAGRKWYGTNADIDDARRALRTLRVFADVGEALTESLGLQATLDAVMQEVVPEFSDWAFITLLDDAGDLRMRAIYHSDAEKSAQLATLVGQLYARGSGTVGSPAAVRTRDPILFEHATYDDAARVVEPNVVEIFWSVIGYNSVLVIPLIVGSAVRGTLTVLMAETHRTFAPHDVPFFMELGRRIAPAIGNAEIYERERRVAQSFQRAALPSSLPEADGFVFSSLYEAGRAEALVGGDWYDAFKLLDGRIVVSIGDVAGSGLRAAVSMANIRQAIRGVAHVHADPELMLEAGDRALRTENSDAFATAFVGVIDPISETISFKSAGHPPVLLRDRDGALAPLHTGGLPLGLRETDREPAAVAPLVEGSLLVLYTDGITEATHDMLEGERRLVDAIARTVDVDPTMRAEAIVRTVLVEESGDDVAVLTVSVVPRKHRTQWTFDARDPVATKRMRNELLSELAFVSDDAEVAALTIVSEVVGNLVRYAPDAAHVDLEFEDGRPVMHVRDTGPGFAFMPKLPPDMFSESGRGLFLIATLAADFNVTRRPRGGSHLRVVFAT